MRRNRGAKKQTNLASAVGNITVAVRLRPLAEDELRSGARTVVTMTGNECAVIEPTALALRDSGMDDVWTRRFYFDHCFSSIDESSPEHASQETVYESIGEQVLQSALDGYNVSIFAYGQTGSGKSYTMMGSEELFSNELLDATVDPESLGLVPRICFGLFDAVESVDESLFEVQLSYLEIYNETVRDLLDPARGTVKVREHPKFGVYVKGLRSMKVHNFGEVSALLSMGNMARAVASTNVNAHSSRSHAIVTMTFRHSTPSEELPGEDVWTEKISHIHLVDLAGSERVWYTGATGQRLREANNINKSLAVLGDVIQSLAEMSRTGKSRHIPYRNSVLTQLLKESLGGNSRTVMLAAVSPCEQQYEETLSTLKYADRAKKVKNRAHANLLTGVNSLTPQVAAMVQTLQQEIQTLKQQLAEKDELLSRAFDESLASPSFDQFALEEDPLTYQLWEREMQLQDLRRMNTSSTQQLQQQQQQPPSPLELESPLRGTATTTTESTLQSVILTEEQVNRTVPQLMNLNQDPLFSECIVFYIPAGTFVIGSDPDVDMQLTGSDIESMHCCVDNRNDVVTIRAINDSPVYVNGERVTDVPQLLSQSDRVIFGRHQVYRFDSSQPGAGSQDVFQRVDWEFAIHELAVARRKDSFRVSSSSSATTAPRQPRISPLHAEARPSDSRSMSHGIAKDDTQPSRHQPHQQHHQQQHHQQQQQPSLSGTRLSNAQPVDNLDHGQVEGTRYAVAGSRHHVVDEDDSFAPSLMPLHNERLKAEQEKLRQRRRAAHPKFSITTASQSNLEEPRRAPVPSAQPTSRPDLFSPVVHANGAGSQPRRFFAQDTGPEPPLFSTSVHIDSLDTAQADEFHREAAQLQQELQDMWEVLSRR